MKLDFDVLERPHAVKLKPHTDLIAAIRHAHQLCRVVRHARDDREYAAACQFEEGRGGDCRRWMPTVKARQFWENMKQAQPDSE